MTNIVFSPMLQAPVILSNPTGAMGLAADPILITAKSNPIPLQGALSLVGAAVRLALAMSANTGGISTAGITPGVISGIVTPRNPATGGVTTNGSAPSLNIAGGAVLTFPRVMLVAVGGDQSYGCSAATGFPLWTTAAAGSAANTAIQQIGAYDIAILNGSTEGFDSNGQRDRENLTQALLKNATYSVKLSQTRRCLPFYYQMMASGSFAGSAYPQYFNLVQANNWWLYESTGGTGTITPAGGGASLVNYSAAWPGAIGSAAQGQSICGTNYGTTSSGSPTGPQGPARTMGNYVAIKYLIRNNSGIDSRFTFGTKNASPSCGGIFLDNCFIALDGAAAVPNSSLDGITIAPGSQVGNFPALDTIQPVMARGNRNMFDQMQVMAATYQPGSTFYNFANFGQYANKYQFGTAPLTAGLDNLQGGLLENVLAYNLGSWECFQTGNPNTGNTNYASGWPNLLANYYQGMDMCLAPKLVGLGTKLPSTDGAQTAQWPIGAGTTLSTVTTGTAMEYQLMRYGLCTALLDDGYFAPGVNGYDYSKVRWYDEYGDDSLTQVNVRRGYLGAPLTTRPTSATWAQGSLGVWSRSFTNGIAIVNPRGNGSQTVTLSANYTKLAGTQQTTINSGAVVSSVALADGDGIILLGPNAPTGFYPAGHWVAAQQAMIQVYPRPDAETSANARHHWAYYDGVHPVQYVIPIGVSFGAFPFVYTLQAGPPGMTIGSFYGSTNYGVVTWTPSASVTNATVTVLVTDQQKNTLTITWTVSTSSSTAHFVFADAVNGNDTNSGTIGAPFKTMGKVLGSTFAATANPGAICYLRAGTYTSLPMYTDNDIGPSGAVYCEMHSTRKPIALLGFPGETATLDMTTAKFGSGDTIQDFFMQNLTVNSGMSTEANYKFFLMNGSGGRIVFDGIHWTNAIYGTTGDDNATMFFSANGGGTLRQYIFLNSCSESGRPSGRTGNNYAGCSLYAWQYGLIRGFVTTPQGNVDGNVYYKGDDVDCEIRECFTQQTGGGAACSIGFHQNLNPTRDLVRHNRCIFGGGGAVYLGHDPPVNAFGTLWAVRNSVIGAYAALYANSGGGPYVFDSNFAQVASGAFPIGSFVQTDGNNQSVTSGGLDTNCLLTGASRTSFLGTVGAEIA